MMMLKTDDVWVDDTTMAEQTFDASLDWREMYNVIKPVRDMTSYARKDGSKYICANSYAQAVAQVIESTLMIDYGMGQMLSVQQLMDCSSNRNVRDKIN